MLSNIIAGSISGWIEGITTHPIDVYKVKVQENKLKNINKSAIRCIYNRNGIRGFYTGLSPKLIGVVPMRLVYWSVLNTSNNILLSNNDTKLNKIYKLIIAGTIGGIAQTIIDNPIEFCKIRLITNNSLKYNIIKTLSINNIYTGFHATLLRNIPFAICSNIGTFWDKNASIHSQFIYGASGGFIGSIITQPFDYYKTELQRHGPNKHFSLIKTFKHNPKILWTGGLVRSILGLCTMGIGSVCFRQIYELIHE